MSWFDHNPLVLHVSLRDLAPEILLASTNVVDDVEHCLKANTSPHLAEQLTGNRDFLHGTLDDVMAGRVTVPADRTGGVLAVRPRRARPRGGKYVYDEVARSGELHVDRRLLPRAQALRLTLAVRRRVGAGASGCRPGDDGVPVRVIPRSRRGDPPFLQAG